MIASFCVTMAQLDESDPLVGLDITSSVQPDEAGDVVHTQHLDAQRDLKHQVYAKDKELLSCFLPVVDNYGRKSQLFVFRSINLQIPHNLL
jgi:hypothetical protein